MDINRNILTEVFELDFLNENCQRPIIRCVIDKNSK
jgi:hypothetical protein